MTHTAPLCGAIVNPDNGHVITASDESDLGVWNSINGSLITKISKAHGTEEITSVGKKLKSGVSDNNILKYIFSGFENVNNI